MNTQIKKLTPKQETFCNAYVEMGNASEAYRRAFDAGKMKPETINRKAVELLNNGKITARVEALQAELKHKSDITKERVLKELAKIGFADTDNLNAKIKALETINKMLGFNEPEKNDVATLNNNQSVVIFKNYGAEKK
ncbi:MAG: terminase small subunit [Bacteroidales bacterium]|jgi:phage terminase small subunit|nr:terminase small subunit [Bacteroidales bacterium]